MDASLSVISTVTVIVTRIAISLSLLRAGALKVPGLEPPGIDQFRRLFTVPHPGDLHRPVRGVTLVQCRDELVPGRGGRDGDDLHVLSGTPGGRVESVLGLHRVAAHRPLHRGGGDGELFERLHALLAERDADAVPDGQFLYRRAHFPIPFRGNPSRSGSGAAKETTDLDRVRKDTSTSVRLSASPWWTQRLWEG